MFSGRVELERTVFICPRRYEPRFLPLEDRSAEIVGEMLHDPWGVKYDVSSFHEILTGNSRQAEVPGRFNCLFVCLLLRLSSLTKLELTSCKSAHSLLRGNQYRAIRERNIRTHAPYEKGIENARHGLSYMN